MDRQSLYYLTALLGAVMMVFGVYFILNPNTTPQELLGISVLIEDTTITLDGRDLWRDSGIQVKPGDKVYVSATGGVMWNKADGKPVPPRGASYKPFNMKDSSGFPIYDANCGSLVGKVNGKPFFIGDNNVITVGETGTLKFMVNDRIGYLDDNTGTFTIRAQVYAPKAR